MDPRSKSRVDCYPFSVSMSDELNVECGFWKDCAVRFIKEYGPRHWKELDPRSDEFKNASGIAGKRDEVRRFCGSLKTKKSPKAAAAFIKTAADDSSHKKRGLCRWGYDTPKLHEGVR